MKRRSVRFSPSVLHLSAKVFLSNILGQGFERETSFLKYVIGPANICLHVGASDGRHSFIMSRLAHQGTIYAFEPAEFGFAVLCNVVAMHGLRNLRQFNVAVSDVEEDISLVTPVKVNGRLGRSYAMIDKDPAGPIRRDDIRSIGVRHQPAHAVALDGFCAAQHLDRVDFIRCDVEGAEGKVLAGGRAMIERDRPNMLIEIHPGALRTGFDSSAENVRDWLLTRGYRMFQVRENRLIASEQITQGPWDDYFFIHPSRAAALPAGPFRSAMETPSGGADGA